MFESGNFTWIILAIFFLYLLARVVPAFVQVWSLRFHTPVVTPQPDLPLAIVQILAPVREILAEKGFDQATPVEIDSIAHEYSLGYLLSESGRGVVANLYTATVPSRQAAAAVSFISLFADGQILQTMQGIGLHTLSTPDHVTLNFVQSRDPEVTWQSHLTQLTELAKRSPPLVLEHEAYLPYIRQHYYQPMLPHLVAVGDVAAAGPTQPDIYYITLREAIRFTWRNLAGARQRQRIALQARLSAPPVNFDINDFPIELEVQTHERLQKAERRRSSVWGRLGLIGGSLLLFLLSFLQLFAWDQLLILLVALIIHEGGHLLGLKLRGYKNLNLIFLPFLGAVAAGEKEQPSLFDRMVVVFLGPVPGLFISFALIILLFIMRQEWISTVPHNLQEILWTVAYYFAFLNGFNLLPFYPLDGGQIIRRLLFARAPLLDALLRMAAVVFFIGLGLVSGDPVILFVAGLFGLGLYSFLRQIGMRRRIVQALINADARDRGGTYVAFKAIRDAGFGAELPFNQKRALVGQLLEIYQDRHEGWLIKGIYLAFYLFSIGLTVANVVLALLVTRL